MRGPVPRPPWTASAVLNVPCHPIRSRRIWARRGRANPARSKGAAGPGRFPPGRPGQWRHHSLRADAMEQPNHNENRCFGAPVGPTLDGGPSRWHPAGDDRLTRRSSTAVLATELEAQGADLSEPSGPPGSCSTAPEGSRPRPRLLPGRCGVATTASYQASCRDSPPAGMEHADAERLLRRTSSSRTPPGPRALTEAAAAALLSPRSWAHTARCSPTAPSTEAGYGRSAGGSARLPPRRGWRSSPGRRGPPRLRDDPGNRGGGGARRPPRASPRRPG